MPISVENEPCLQEDGTRGDWIILNEETGEVEACFTDETEARAIAARIRRSKGEQSS